MNEFSIAPSWPSRKVTAANPMTMMEHLANHTSIGQTSVTAGSATILLVPSYSLALYS